MESDDHSIDPRIRRISENRDVLLEVMDVNPVLLAELSGDDVLDECTRQSITSNKKYDTNKRFFDWLVRESSPKIIDIVLQKLRDDQQSHVANVVDGKEGERPLSEKAKQRIRKLSGWLTQNMTTDHGLIDHLLAEGAINSRDWEDIKARPTESARAMELIDVVLRRSDRTLEILLKALVKSNQNHIAQVLEKDEIIVLCLSNTHKTVGPTLQRSPETDIEEELRVKLKSISSHNFVIAILKATNDIFIYVLCEDGDVRQLLEELFGNIQHRAVLLEELIKLSTSDAKVRSPLESNALQLIQDILPRVGQSGIVGLLQTGADCGLMRELGSISNSGLPSVEKYPLETDNYTPPEQGLVSPEKSHVLSSEETVPELDRDNTKKIEESLTENIDSRGQLYLPKIEDTNAPESKNIDENVGQIKSDIVHNKPEDRVDPPETSNPVIQSLELRLKLSKKQNDRLISEIAQLRKNLNQLEEQKMEISQDLNEILELNTEDQGRLITELKQRERKLEDEIRQLNSAPNEANFALQQTKEEHGKFKDEHCKHSKNLQNSNLTDIINDIITETKEGSGWQGLDTCSCFELAAGGILNKKFVLSLFFIILRNTKSNNQTFAAITAACLWLLPFLLHLPVGIPDAILSFCFTNVSLIFWSGIVVTFIYTLMLVRESLWGIVPFLLVLVRLLLLYLESGGVGPGIGVGRYCQEDKCVYMFCWEYISYNMRMKEEFVEQILAQHDHNGAGGLFKTRADFAVWNKYTSHRWDKVMSEFKQDGRFVRKLYTKPLFGTSPFHLLTVFRLETGLVTAGHGSLFYGDPMLKLCLLDTNGNIITSFGGQFGPSRGVPMVLDADREGCLIVADHMSGRVMTLCSDVEHMKQFRDRVIERNNPLEMCLNRI